MASAFAETTPPIEQTPRRALLWGAGLLVLGLAAVGVGQADEGAPLALAGLLITIYGIHRFGRLGPEDPATERYDVAEAKVEKRRRMGKSRAP
jgi:hypothetical protein